MRTKPGCQRMRFLTWGEVKTLVPSEPQVKAGIYGCSSHSKWYENRYWPIPTLFKLDVRLATAVAKHCRRHLFAKQLIHCFLRQLFLVRLQRQKTLKRQISGSTVKSSLYLDTNLVGGIPTPLKNMSSSVGMIIPNIWENKTCSKPPTRNVRLFEDIMKSRYIMIKHKTLHSH